MIFALFIIVIFVGIMTFAQFGQQESNESPRAQVYAQNMVLWHQAAQLEARRLPPAVPNCPGVPPALCPAVFLNATMWNSAGAGQSIPGSRLRQNWLEYRPMVVMSNTSGWQSFYIRNVNGYTGAASGVGSNNNEAYVLTIFRGFGGGNATTASGIGMEKGSTDENNFIKTLARTVTERSGIGRLKCDTVLNVCEFLRLSVEVAPSAAQRMDDSIKFSTTVFPLMTGVPSTVVFPPDGIAFRAAQTLNGRPAILTRIEN